MAKSYHTSNFNDFDKVNTLQGEPEEDHHLKIKHLKQFKENEYSELSKLYELVTNQTKILSTELRMYQERLGHVHLDREEIAELIDPVLAKIGLREAKAANKIGKKFDYITPLMVAYKHKMNVLDKHLKVNYRKMIRYDNDIKNQMEMQSRIIGEIEAKYQQTLDYEQSIAEDDQVEFDFMDHVSKDDLFDKLDILDKENEQSKKLIENLKKERRNLDSTLASSKQKISKLKEEVHRLEDAGLNHVLDKLERENTILSEKYIEVSEKNSELSGALLQKKSDLSDLEREHRVLKVNLEIQTKDKKSAEEDMHKYERKIQGEQKKLEDIETKRKFKLTQMEEEVKVRENAVNKLKTEIDRISEEKDELNKTWSRLKGDFGLLEKKKGEYKALLLKHKHKSIEASKMGALRGVRKEEYSRQVELMNGQHQKRLELIQEEYQRKTRREEDRWSGELAKKNREVTRLKGVLEDLEDREDKLITKVERLKNEQKMFDELAKSEQKRADEIQRLEDEIATASVMLEEKERCYSVLDSGKVNLEILNKESVELATKVNLLKQSKNNLIETVETLDSECRGLEAELASKKAVFQESIRNNLDSHSKREGDIRMEIASTESQCLDLKNKIKAVFKLNENQQESLRSRIKQKQRDYERKLREDERIIQALKEKILDSTLN